MASITLNPSAYVSCGATSGTASISGQTTPVGKGSSNTTYATLTTSTSASSTSYAFWKFDCSSIPSTATIDSVSCTALCYVSSTSRISTRSVQLYNGTTTAKGSSATFSNSTTSATTLTCGTWTRDELDNIHIRVAGTRGTNQQSATIRFYGADLTITYTEAKVQYTVTINSSGTGTTTPTGAQTVDEGDSLAITLVPDEENTEIAITDNGVDVSAQLIEASGRSAGDSHEVSAVPASYTTSGSLSGTAYQDAVGNGSDYTTGTSNVYCQTSGSTAYIDYAFDFSSIPSDNVIITNVEAIATGHCENASQSTEVADIQLYCDGTAKGTKSSFTSTTNTATTLDTGDWTRSELDKLTLRFIVGYYGGLMTGATIKVTYMELGASGVAYTYNVSNVATNHTINIVYSEGVVTMYTVNTSITNGTLLSPAETVEVRSGRSVDFSFKGDDKANFVSMTVNDVPVTPTKSATSQDSTAATWSVSTNYDTYSTYVISNVNSDTSSYFWSNGAQTTGKYVLFTFNKFINLTAATFYSSNSTDYPNTCNKLQCSADGNTWTDLGTFQSSQTSTFTGLNAQKIKYVRIYADSTISNWLVLNTATFTYTTPAITAGYTYTLSNIDGDKTVVITFAGNNKVTVKIGGAWKAGTPYKKVDGAWVTLTPKELATYLQGKTIIKK